jgi:hypothetical protein
MADQHDHDHDGHGHDHDGHDHDHDHDHDDHEPTPEEIEAAEKAIARLASALANIDDESLRRAIASMRESSRLDMAQQLGLSRATIHLGDALVPLFRRKVLLAPPIRQLSVAFALAEACNDDTVEALGDAHEDPTLEQLREVLPGVIEKHGLPTVTLMLAAYAASDAVSQPVIAELLDADEQYALPDPPDAETLGPAYELELHHRTPEEKAAQKEKREGRKAAKDAKRLAAQPKREADARAQAARRAALHKSKKRP